jgi:hypothetical protein
MLHLRKVVTTHPANLRRAPCRGLLNSDVPTAHIRVFPAISGQVADAHARIWAIIDRLPTGFTPAGVGWADAGALVFQVRDAPAAALCPRSQARRSYQTSDPCQAGATPDGSALSPAGTSVPAPRSTHAPPFRPGPPSSAERTAAQANARPRPRTLETPPRDARSARDRSSSGG